MMGEGRVAEPPQRRAEHHHGVPSAPGVAFGPAHVLHRRALIGGRRRVPSEERLSEVARFDDAVRGLDGELSADASGFSDEQHGGIALALLTSHRAVLADPQLVSRTRDLIADEGQGAERALKQTLGELAQRFAQLRSPEFRDLWRDVEGIGSALLARLHGDADRLVGVEPGDILVARSVTIRDVIDLCAAGAAALVLEEGSLTSHVVVLCRSAGLAAVSGVRGALEAIDDETFLFVDGDAGVVLVGEAARSRRNTEASAPTTAPQAEPPSPAASRLVDETGRAIVLRANLDIDLDADRARRLGADGVGLWRTFYLYLGRETVPSEDELAAIFAGTLAEFAPAIVTVRLLDLSGPFAERELPHELRGLGDCRGVRLMEQRPEVMDTQLRALMRASAAGRLRILLPFVSELEEITSIAARARFHADDLGVAMPQIGVMIEVPAILMQIDDVAAASDFLAVGSNDLTALLLARSRDAPSARSDTGAPAVLFEAIRRVVEAGERHGVSVSICGEIASQPMHAAALLASGLREFSIAPRLMPTMRAAMAVALGSAARNRELLG